MKSIMKSLLIAIKPKWCAKIMNGEKTIEVRKENVGKTVQKLIDEQGFADIYVYCTKGKSLIYTDGTDGKGDYVDYKYYESYKGDKNDIGSGKVIFKFRCYKVEEILPFEEYESPFGMAYKLTKDKIVCCQKAQLTYDEYNHCLKGKNGCAIHISDLEIFDEPKELSEFRKWYRVFESTEKVDVLPDIKLRKAPQSMVYIEVEDEQNE